MWSAAEAAYVAFTVTLRLTKEKESPLGKRMAQNNTTIRTRKFYETLKTK